MFALRSVLFVFLFLPSQSWAYSTAQDFAKDQSQLKALVFLSATCPCSKSHVDHLNQMQKQYADLKLYAVITDSLTPHTLEVVRSYYSPANFNFSVIKDESQVLLTQYKALKTPHIVLLERQKSGTYKTIYEGGVSNQRQFSRSRKKFFQENLVAYFKGEKLPYRRGRSLGCYIRRL